MTKINREKYSLPEHNYSISDTVKTQIVLGHSCTDDFSFYKTWLTRKNGKYKKVAHYTVALSGRVYQHVPDEHVCEVTGDLAIDGKLIVINLINEGWLEIKPDLGLVNWQDKMYQRTMVMGDFPWRGKSNWAPYTEKQFNALVRLTCMLCEKHNIPGELIMNNAFKIDKAWDFNGVAFRSNYHYERTDLNPTFPYDRFATELDRKL